MTPPLLECTAAQLLRAHAAQIPDETAYIFDGQRFTWQQTEQLAEQAAMELLALGVKKNTHVALWSVNSITLVVYLLAAMKLGAVPVVINYSYRAYELRGVLQRSDAELLLLGEPKKNADYRKLAQTVQPDCPRLRQIVQLQLPPAQSLSKAQFEMLAQLEAAVTCQDTACITFTSGTTKLPKPVMLSYYNLVNNARQFTARMHVERTRGDVLMAPLPLFHSSGMTGMLFHSLVTGVPTVLHRMFRAEQALRDIEAYHVSVLMAVPSMLELLADDPNRAQYDLSSLRVGQSSGASITPEKLLRIVQNLGFRHFLMGYGQTECSPLVTTTLYEDDLVTATATAGLPLPHVELRIQDLPSGAICAADQTGEIQVRGFNTMQGYYRADRENAEKYTADGWLKTTDLGWLDKTGRLHFAARSSEIIIRHGENISPAEIEAVAGQFSRDILAVKAVGVPEPVVQEEIACVVQTNGAVIDPDALRAYIKSVLASYKTPKYVVFVKEFPMTATGKIDQAAVKQLAADYAAAQKRKQEEPT